MFDELAPFYHRIPRDIIGFIWSDTPFSLGELRVFRMYIFVTSLDTGLIGVLLYCAIFRQQDTLKHHDQIRDQCHILAQYVQSRCGFRGPKA